jgi:hypothetical protein
LLFGLFGINNNSSLRFRGKQKALQPLVFKLAALRLDGWTEAMDFLAFVYNELIVALGMHFHHYFKSITYSIFGC